jgi:Survival motor neuron (SMN) interacting protein 1 (SIP1)
VPRFLAASEQRSGQPAMDQALPVDDVEFDMSVEVTGDISSMSAEQYISWVRCQARGIPPVVRAEVRVREREVSRDTVLSALPRPDTDVFVIISIYTMKKSYLFGSCWLVLKIRSEEYAGRQTRTMPAIDDIRPCPEELMPSTDWEIATLHSFSELRAQLSALSESGAGKERKVAVPPLKDADGWHRFCLEEELNLELRQMKKRLYEEHCGPSNDNFSADRSLAMDDGSSEGVSGGGGGGVSGVTYLKACVGFEEVGEEEDGELEDGEAEEGDDEGDDEDDEDDVFTGHFQTGEWRGDVNVQPTLSLLLQFDQVLTCRLLGHHVAWLEERRISEGRSQWLYSLLARLEKPLHGDMAALVRQLYRRCCFLRSELIVTKHPDFEKHLAALNTLISISGAYFGQGEQYSNLNSLTPLIDAETANYGREAADGVDFGDDEGDDEAIDEIMDGREGNDSGLDGEVSGLAVDRSMVEGVNEAMVLSGGGHCADDAMAMSLSVDNEVDC